MLASEIMQSVQLDDALRATGSTCLSEYAQTLEDDPATRIEAFLSDRPIEYRSQLAGLIAIEMRHRRANGDACLIESYLARFPELHSDTEQLLDLIYAEYCARRQRGEAVVLE